MVVQFSSPHQIADYVHRVGRTARAGRSGSAVLFLAPNEVEFVRTLESKRIRYDDRFTKLLSKMRIALKLRRKPASLSNSILNVFFFFIFL